MKVLLQRVREASVTVEGEVIGQVGQGYLLLVGIAHGDSVVDIEKMASKVAKLRLFPNAAGKFDHSLLDIAGEALVVSQFTLMGNTQKGNRPSFVDAAPPDHAAPLCAAFTAALEKAGVSKVESGRFGADMKVALVNDGPVTLMLEI